ncbi:Beta-lactamase-like protein 2 [Talaromyces islandicus]|uniref:Beta-lactamase-like protein 2 n=1 Tax=Talaromyces islandicus TaxID=28573 RepID=A0A0U1LKH6_TALIS|nr:Beta-lactamase-like protein 2 [Talaromyces islandicus]
MKDVNVLSRSINKNVNLYAFEEYLSAQASLLPDLPEIKKISPRVIRVLGGNPGLMQLQGTNTYIVGTGTKRILVDTGQGIPQWTQLISSTIEEHDITIEKVLLTHWHGDHTGGVPDLIRMYPDLEGSIYKNRPDAGQKPISDGQIFKTEGATIRAVFTPGHSVDHMCFLLQEEEALFTGDNILGHGTTAVEDLGAYMDSLFVMQRQNCKIGYPGHGELICDLKLVMQTEIGRKKRRERQIIAGLKALQERNPGRMGALPRDLVTEVFGDLPEDVVNIIFLPFMKELLMKLAIERRVGFRMYLGDKLWFILSG